MNPASLHKYLYANARPVNYTDPTGNESLGELMVGIQIEGILGSTMQCFWLSGLRNALIGAVAGAVFGGVDAALGGAKGWDIVNAAMNGGISGAEFGALATFAELRPLLAILGVGSGIEGVEESLKNGNYAQAAERAIVLSLALKSLKTDLFDPKACFTGDTLVYTGEGYKEIQDIKAGDEVYSENPETGEKGLKKVVNVFVKEVHQIVHIVADGEDINTTPTHPFWVEGKGWTEAGDIKVGDKLKMYSGEILEVKSAYVEYLENPVKVYNFEVEDWHTYFVSKSNVFVHNVYDVTKGSKTGEWKKRSDWAKPDVSIRKQLGGKGRIKDLEHNKNLNGVNVREILEKTPVELEQMVKNGQLTDKQLKTIRKTFEGRDLGSKGRGN